MTLVKDRKPVRTPLEESDLTTREYQVLWILSYGKTVGQVSEELGVSYSTARFHAMRIRSKFVAETYHQAVAFAFMDGLVH